MSVHDHSSFNEADYDPVVLATFRLASLIATCAKDGDIWPNRTTYGEIWELQQNERVPRGQWWIRSFRKPLHELALACVERGLPHIGSLIVQKHTGRHSDAAVANIWKFAQEQGIAVGSDPRAFVEDQATQAANLVSGDLERAFGLDWHGENEKKARKMVQKAVAAFEAGTCDADLTWLDGPFEDGSGLGLTYVFKYFDHDYEIEMDIDRDGYVIAADWPDELSPALEAFAVSLVAEAFRRAGYCAQQFYLGDRTIPNSAFKAHYDVQIDPCEGLDGLTSYGIQLSFACEKIIDVL